jgi:hypothetical protein
MSLKGNMWSLWGVVVLGSDLILKINFVSFRLVWFSFVSFRSVSFCFVWFHFVSFGFASFRFVSISFRTLQVPISNHCPNLLSMVLWTSYTCYIVPIPMIFWLRYTWNIENPFMVLWTPSFDRNEGVQFYHGAVQYTMTKIGLRGQNTIWYLKLLVSFRFVRFRFISFRFYFVSHFTGTHIKSLPKTTTPHKDHMFPFSDIYI